MHNTDQTISTAVREIQRLTKVGKMKYFVRLNKKLFKEATWRECDCETYIKCLPSGTELDGTLTEVGFVVVPKENNKDGLHQITIL